MSALEQDPDRVTIGNVETGDSISAQFNPNEIAEKLGVSWKNLEIMGLSHRPRQYQGTDNLHLSFDLGFDAISLRTIDTNVQAADRGTPAFARRFLHHLCYARRGAADVVGGSPPRILFSWPTLYALTCTIDQLEFQQTRFNLFMKPVLFVCKVTMQETRTTRIYSEDVLASGTMRAP